MKQNGVVASQDPRCYSLHFDFNIWFRARKVTRAFEKRAPGQSVFYTDLLYSADLSNLRVCGICAIWNRRATIILQSIYMPGVVLRIHHCTLCNGSKHTELLVVTAYKQQGKFTNADLNPDSDLIFFKEDYLKMQIGKNFICISYNNYHC